MTDIKDLGNKLEELKGQCLKKVAELASSGDTREMARFARLAEDCENTLSKLTDLLETARVIEARVSSKPETLPERPELSVESSPMVMYMESEPAMRPESRRWASRRMGLAVRSGWVKKMKKEQGLKIKEVGRYHYEVKKGSKVGIAYGTELSGKPDSWFLSLPNEEYDVVVFLCESRTGHLLDFVISVYDLAEAWEDISIGREGRQRKINIRRVNGNFHLILKGGTKFSLGSYLSNYGALKTLKEDES